MIRPLDWRDLALLHRLREDGLCLDSQQAYVRGHNTLPSTLLGMLSPAMSILTLVARDADPDGLTAIGQVSQRNGGSLARLAFISPAEALSHPSGLRLLEALCQAAGERGAMNLVAEADENGSPFACLRQAGFAIFARQNVWRLAVQPPQDPRGGKKPTAEHRWRVETGHDVAAIHFLYANIVPALVQQIEPPPQRGPRGLVHASQGEILGYLDIERGPLGTWVQPYFHPAAEKPGELLWDFVRHMRPTRSTSLLVCVRSYQSWINGLLEKLGFELLCSQAVMVKRLTAAIRRPALAPLPALEKTQPEATTPFARWTGHQPSSRTPPRP